MCIFFGCRVRAIVLEVGRADFFIYYWAVNFFYFTVFDAIMIAYRELLSGPGCVVSAVGVGNGSLNELEEVNFHVDRKPGWIVLHEAF